jgi:2-(3-amino-3-carboxypropyl)histidine synthase
MTLKIEDSDIRRIIKDKNAKRVVFNAPDGLLSLTRTLASELESEYSGLKTIVIADPTYGSCDTVDLDAQRLGADIAFHVGHNTIVPRFGKITHSINAYDDVKFDEVVKIAAKTFLGMNYRIVGLTTFAQHLHELVNVARLFENEGISSIIGKGLGQLHDGQIFGCEFYPAFNVKDSVDCMVLLGQSVFHALGVALSSGKKTYMLDPYANEVIDVQRTADERLTKSILAIYKAREAETFGVIIGLKEGQIMTDQSIKIKEKLESFGKKVQLIALREITSDRLDSLTDIQAFVQTGCPRISVDGYTFSKPVLSVPQADALISLLSGNEIDAKIFLRRNWL